MSTINRFKKYSFGILMNNITTIRLEDIFHSSSQALPFGAKSLQQLVTRYSNDSNVSRTRIIIIIIITNCILCTIY